MARRPQVDVNCIKKTEQGEPPRDAIDDGPLPSCGELVDNGSEEDEVNEIPVQRMKRWVQRKGDRHTKSRKPKEKG